MNKKKIINKANIESMSNDNEKSNKKISLSRRNTFRYNIKSNA